MSAIRLHTVPLCLLGLFAGPLALASPTAVRAADEPAEVVAYNEALQTFETAYDDWKDDVLDELAAAQARARVANESETLAALEVAEKSLRVENLVPADLPRPLQQRLATLTKPLDLVAKRSIRSLERKGRDDAADRVRESYDLATAALRLSEVRMQLLGRWEMRNGSAKFVFAFQPDGTVVNENTRATLPYTIDMDRQTVTIQGPNWKDTMFLPLNARLTKGKNARGGRIEYRKLR